MKDKVVNSKLFKIIKEKLFFIVFLIVEFIVINIPLPYYIMAPGGIIDISSRINIEGKTEQEGTLNLLYVSEYSATVGSTLMSFILPDWDLEKIEELQVSDESLEDIEVRNKVMLNNSKQNAILVAYTKAGKEVKINGYENVVIATTIDNSSLEVGDVIIEANGITIESVDKLRSIISNTEVGDSINLKVLRDNKEENVEATVYEEDGSKVIGVMVVTNYDYELDPEIELNFKSTEGGASGGLMIALNIYNALVEEDITKGYKIAGTGTIDILGNVGEIDGIKYKLMGAVKSGMEIVFVPTGNYEEALQVKEEKGYDITIVSVATIDDALEYLNELE